jgi:TonB family protein
MPVLPINIKFTTVLIASALAAVTFGATNKCVADDQSNSTNKATSPTIYVTREELNAYLQEIEKRLKAKWAEAKSNDADTVLAFDIDKVGNVSNFRLASSLLKAVPKINEKDKRLVESVAPFPPLPSSIRGVLTTYFSFYSDLSKCQAYSDYGNNAYSESYIADLERRIKRFWLPPRDGKRVVLAFKVHGDGLVTDIQVIGDQSFSDDAAVKAVQKASPVPPLPEGSVSPLEVQLAFDWNNFGPDIYRRF